MESELDRLRRELDELDIERVKLEERLREVFLEKERVKYDINRAFNDEIRDKKSRLQE